MRVFWVYFWTKGKKSGEVKWVVKWKGKKHIVDHVAINAPVITKGRKTNPHGIIFGKANHANFIRYKQCVNGKYIKRVTCVLWDGH